jgi:DNA-binding transcriptional regulator YiaG
MDISEAIKNVRLESILSQDAFAKEIGVSQITITRWETGKSVPNYSAMKRLLAYCEQNNINGKELSDLWRSKNE